MLRNISRREKLMNSGIIYAVICLLNNKVYIGKTIQDFEKRKQCHLRKMSEKKQNGDFTYSTKFYNALRKYGIDNFKWEVIESGVGEDILNEREIFYIEKYNSYNDGYNSTIGGDGGDTYSLLTNEELELIKSKISKSVKNTFNNPEYRKKLSERTKGVNNPMYGKESAMKGKKHTEETKKKQSKVAKIREISKLSYPRIIEKPWGEECIYSYNKFYCCKKILIKKGHVTSLQYHNEKTETSYIHEGRARVWLKRKGEKEFTIFEDVGPGFFVYLTPGDIHRIEALEDITLFEASTPETWDVVRLEDSYARAGTSNP